MAPFKALFTSLLLPAVIFIQSDAALLFSLWFQPIDAVPHVMWDDSGSQMSRGQEAKSVSLRCIYLSPITAQLLVWI